MDLRMERNGFPEAKGLQTSAEMVIDDDDDDDDNE